MVFSRILTPPFLNRACTSVGPGWRILEALYGWACGLQRKLYNGGLLPVTRVTCPVISIGNLTVGGTGKTPVTLSLCQYLQQLGLRVVVLSRGYNAPVQTRYHLADSPDYGDEAYWLHTQLQPHGGAVVVGVNRAVTAQQALQNLQPDVLVLDDGFQHRRLHRDWDIVLVDGSQPLQPQHLLPAGPYREPWTALHRAHTVLLTKTVTDAVVTEANALLAHVAPGVHLGVAPFSVQGCVHPGSGLECRISPETALILLSGIAQPQAFEQHVREHLAGTVIQHFMYPDHVNYGPSQITPVLQSFQNNPQALCITTHKDWVKLQRVLPTELHGRIGLFQMTPVVSWPELLQHSPLAGRFARPQTVTAKV